MTIDSEKITLEDKESRLHKMLQGLKKPALAFSGGVDSSLLLAACAQAGVQVVAIMADTPVVPQFEKDDAQRVAAETGMQLVTIALNPLTLPEFAANVEGRCYYCKKLIFTAIKAKSVELGCGCLLDGTNVDDTGDYRPGRRATAELGVISPLLECGFTKADVRALAAKYKLSVADKPAYACLASRIAYGESITLEKLKMVERAEDALRQMGLHDLRVRCHGRLARIEVGSGQIAAAAGELRTAIVVAVKNAGFNYVTLDLEGFRSGSMNVGIAKK